MYNSSGRNMFSFLRGRLRTSVPKEVDEETLRSFHSFEVGFGPVKSASILPFNFLAVKLQ